MLTRAALLGALLVVVVGTAACDNENVAACKEYVEAFQALPCATGTDPGVDCNAYADYPCAVPDYFSCLRITQQCRAPDNSPCVDPNDPDCKLFSCKDAADPACAGQTLATCPDELDCSN